MTKTDMADDATLLAALKAESQQAIGYENDDELKSSRETALMYFKGDMSDLKVGRNRSKVVSTDVADTIESWLPDILEIFTGGEDVVVFTPNTEEDQDAAQQETDYINYIFFQRCNGFEVLQDAFLNAALVKTGVFHWYWDETEVIDRKLYDELSLDALQVALSQGYEIVEGDFGALEASNPNDINAMLGQEGEESPKVTGLKLERVDKIAGVKVVSVPPENFSVGADTDNLRNGTYCSWRKEARVQDLLDKGYDEDKVRKLQDKTDDDSDHARDTVGESDTVGDTGDFYLNSVEIIEHYIRYRGRLWRIVTDTENTVILDKDELDSMPFSSITPFRVPGRFHGLSLADKSIDTQRINTSLMRGMLDSVAFKLNNRVIVSSSGSNANTMPDLLRNEPGSPIRVERMDALAPLNTSADTFSYAEAKEMVDVMNERKTGVQRGAQGMNPDSLHDTASGARFLLSEGQKRTRRIARSFAETGVKDMFLGLHALIRKYATKGDYARLRGKWVPIEPDKWCARTDMTIEIGVGSGGRDQEIALMREVIQMQSQALEGGLGIVTAENVYNAATRFMERGGIKAPELYVTMQKEQPQEQEGPPPEVVKAQMDGQIKLQTTQMEMQAKIEIEREKIALDERVKMAELQLRQKEMALEVAMGRNVRNTTPGGDLSV